MGYKRRPADLELPAGKGYCVRCRRTLDAAQFRPNPRTRSGLDSWCRDCRAAAVRRWRAEHRDEHLRRRRELYAQRRDEHRARARARWAARRRAPESCAFCGGPIVGRRADARYCSEAHRRAAWANATRRTPPVVDPAELDLDGHLARLRAQAARP